MARSIIIIKSRAFPGEPPTEESISVAFLQTWDDLVWCVRWDVPSDDVAEALNQRLDESNKLTEAAIEVRPLWFNSQPLTNSHNITIIF